MQLYVTMVMPSTGVTGRPDINPNSASCDIAVFSYGGISPFCFAS